MKKIAFTVLGLVIVATVTAFVLDEGNVPSEKKVSMESLEVVKPTAADVIDNKCYGCHNSESKNEKGRKKLSFDTFDELSTAKKIAKYEGIHEVVSEGEMPPEKFLNKYPDKALTDEEKEILLGWAKSEGDKLAE